MKDKTYNINGVIRIAIGTNWNLKKCLWIDSFDSFAGIHSKAQYRAFKKKLLKSLKELDKIEKVLGK